MTGKAPRLSSSLPPFPSPFTVQLPIPWACPAFLKIQLREQPGHQMVCLMHLVLKFTHFLIGFGDIFK